MCACLLHHTWTGWSIALIKHSPYTLCFSYWAKHDLCNYQGLLWPMEYDGDDNSWCLVRLQVSNAVSALYLENVTWEIHVPMGSSYGGKRPWKGKKSTWRATCKLSVNSQGSHLPQLSSGWQDQQNVCVWVQRDLPKKWVPVVLKVGWSKPQERPVL